MYHSVRRRWHICLLLKPLAPRWRQNWPVCLRPFWLLLSVCGFWSVAPGSWTNSLLQIRDEDDEGRALVEFAGDGYVGV